MRNWRLSVRRSVAYVQKPLSSFLFSWRRLPIGLSSSTKQSYSGYSHDMFTDFGFEFGDVILSFFQNVRYIGAMKQSWFEKSK